MGKTSVNNFSKAHRDMVLKEVGKVDVCSRECVYIHACYILGYLCTVIEIDRTKTFQPFVGERVSKTSKIVKSLLSKQFQIKFING